MTPLDQVPWPKGPYFTNGLFVWVRNPATCDGSQVAIEIRPVRYDEDVISRAQWEALAVLWAESPTMAALLERLLAAMKWRTHSLTEEERTALAEARSCLSRLGRGK